MISVGQSGGVSLGLGGWRGVAGRLVSVLTLVEVDIEMAKLRKGKHRHHRWLFILEFLAHGGQFIFGELPMLSLGRFPKVGRHLVCWGKIIVII